MLIVLHTLPSRPSMLRTRRAISVGLLCVLSACDGKVTNPEAETAPPTEYEALTANGSRFPVVLFEGGLVRTLLGARLSLIGADTLRLVVRSEFGSRGAPELQVDTYTVTYERRDEWLRMQRLTYDQYLPFAEGIAIVRPGIAHLPLVYLNPGGAFARYVEADLTFCPVGRPCRDDPRPSALAMGTTELRLDGQVTASSFGRALLRGDEISRVRQINLIGNRVDGQSLRVTLYRDASRVYTVGTFPIADPLSPGVDTMYQAYIEVRTPRLELSGPVVGTLTITRAEGDRLVGEVELRSHPRFSVLGPGDRITARFDALAGQW